MNQVLTYPNPDLSVGADNKSYWSHADQRRHGWHNLHRIARYGMSFRAARVMKLEKRMDSSIANLDAVRHFTSLPWFSAMIIVRGQDILFERYSADFGPDFPHSIQSITKTTMNLIIGTLVEHGVLELGEKVGHYIPQIDSGYADASVQQVLNMDVENEYSEDFTDPKASYYRHEEAMGWRLPRDPEHEETQRAYLSRIKSANAYPQKMGIKYKDANTAVMAWLAEQVSGKPLRAFLASLVDAAGLEGALHITTDRDGFPAFEGGASLTARDLSRYLSLFVRRGKGVGGEMVGSEAFIEKTMLSGVPMSSPYEGLRYSNHAMVRGRALGHGGWGGQYALANLDTGTVGVFFSVIENQHATNTDYLEPIIQMLESIADRTSEHANLA